MAGRRRVIELAIGEEDLAALRAIARSRTESANRVSGRGCCWPTGRTHRFLRMGRTLGVHHQTVQRCVERALVSVITLFHGLVRPLFDGLSGGWADHGPTRSSMPSCSRPSIGIGGRLAAPPLPHHRAYGSVHGGSAD